LTISYFYSSSALTNFNFFSVYFLIFSSESAFALAAVYAAILAFSAFLSLAAY
jgi:hypothetical protein